MSRGLGDVYKRQFLMHFDDWIKHFHNLYINIDFPEDWTGVRFMSAWTKSNSGGIPHTAQRDVLEKYAMNPQFFMKPLKKTEVVLSLTQMGGRLPLNGVYSTYPFIDQIKYSNVGVFRLPPGQETINIFDKNNLVFLGPLKRERENPAKITLEAG